MKDKSFILRLIGALLVVAMLGAACSEAGNDAGDATSGDQVETNDDSMSSDTPDAEVTTAGLDEGAAALSQTLTDLLDSHVYLASIAVYTGLTAGLDSPEFEAAAATLDQNSQDLAGAIESVYGAEAGDAFLKLWRQHIGFFVDYTAGKATKDDAKANKALKALENYKKDFSEFLDTATGGELPADAALGRAADARRQPDRRHRCSHRRRPEGVRQDLRSRHRSHAHDGIRSCGRDHGSVPGQVPGFGRRSRVRFFSRRSPICSTRTCTSRASRCTPV